MIRYRLTILSVLIAAAAFAWASGAEARPERRYSDAHLHYVDFAQQTAGMPALLDAMEVAGIADVLIMGIPVVKKWHQEASQRPRFFQSDDGRVYWYGVTDVLVARAVSALPQEQRSRFHPFICGFNPTDLNAVDHIQRMLDWFPGLWQGIGEIFTRHDDLTALTYGETARANHRALDRVYKLAAENDLPVLIHSNITSVRERRPLYLPELEEALRKHPRTRFIWAHAGMSSAINRRFRVDFLLEALQRLLRIYNNLWIDLSWSVLESYILDENKSPRAEWVKLINRYPDRFLIGSDAVGRFMKLEKKMSAFDGLLGALTQATSRKVARENFLAILPAAARTPDP